jgi:hypothetical protein
MYTFTSEGDFFLFDLDSEKKQIRFVSKQNIDEDIPVL